MSNQREFSVFTNPNAIKNVVANFDSFDEPLIVTQTKTVDDYVASVFNEVNHSDLFVRDVARPDGGIGPHFDIYDQHVSPEFPYVGTFNRRGLATLRAAWLNEELQHYYDTTYPVPTAESKEARRPLGHLALIHPDATVYQARIQKGVGLVIPQSPATEPGKYLVHDVVPDRVRPPIIQSSNRQRFRQAILGTSGTGGDFQKFVVPKDTQEAKKAVKGEGYMSFDQYLERRQAARDFEQQERESTERVREANRRIHMDTPYERPGGTIFD